MRTWDHIPLVPYTKTEEVLHTVTHAAGLILSAWIVKDCLLPPIRSGNRFSIVCAALYLFGTTVMFVTSALYHGVKPSNAKRLLRLLDHCMIFFTVAGTATACAPAVLATAGRVPAMVMCVCGWLGAVSGLVLTLTAFEKTKALQMALYIGTGAVCAVCGAKAFTILPHGAFFFFLGGSGTLLIGAVLYGAGKKHRYFHTIFHVFIDIGLTIFFIGIRQYCY
ncbi:MAG: hemolysin III family protein [Clostridia bacterium]|nr:hemolysin III family protein [Clostridia bacterium]